MERFSGETDRVENLKCQYEWEYERSRGERRSREEMEIDDEQLPDNNE